MPKFAANLSCLFTELPFLDRFAAAAVAGFAAVEFQFPYEFPAVEVAARLAAQGLEPVLFNASPGNPAAGERGLAALPDREADFEASFERALDYARIIGCKRLHVLAGLRPAERPREAVEAVYVANLRHAADRAAEDDVTLLIEPLNTRDNPGYALTTTGQALAILDRVERANVKLQLDFYHCQVMEGDLAGHARRLFGRYGHVQIANVPGRHEPGQGEIHFPYLFDLLDALGYDGWVGCEYRPSSNTLDSLGWARRWKIGGGSRS